ncbi:penicillin-insensitive murein endopeptidase [Rhodobacter sp. Har01]|uniref:penicillin-insensitive murein endopeptidase n=1 Tax=Rhodobacter sp. Har01 TaxID=2883999 RepID=UPI001D083E26|nr:penicillin-insensitive murein endopeptidase [Rhodobacter sp. Har01]MCB6177729.1 penicillin-insensitive murein endopeptidase [Rhodobacter sp. Har01]
MIPRILLCLALCLPAPAMAENLANKLFGAKQAPSQQDPMPIGSYARGCAAGLVELPETGPTWQAMRLSRGRNYGHPAMIGFLIELSQAAAQIGWGRGLYIGDISQPRGGPMTSGHASHQIGLDADIWWLAPQRLDLSAKARENISSIPMRSADQRSVTEAWGPRAAKLLKIAASDPRVDRVFVAAAIKIELCRGATKADKKWLQKIRPIAGHDTHFHVRLKCPKGARLCETQKPTVADLSNGGDGCDDTLTWWVTDYLNPPKGAKKKPKDDDAPRKKGPREFTLADLPKQCRTVLASD